MYKSNSSNILINDDAMNRYNLLYLIALQLLIMFATSIGCEKTTDEKLITTKDIEKQKATEPVKRNTEEKDQAEPKSKDSIEKTEIVPDKPNIITLTPLSILQDFIKKECFTEQNPWLVAQGIKALGADSKMPSGKNAVEFLMQFVEKVTIKGENYLKFRTGAYFDTLTDANPNMVLKILLEAKVNVNKVFKTKHGAVSLKMLINDAKMLFQPKIAKKMEYPNIDWTIEVLTELLNPQQYQWVNAYGDMIDFEKIVERNFAVLENHIIQLEQNFDNKRRISAASMIHGDINGGAHLFFSTVKATRMGFGSDSMKKRLKKHAELVFYRLKYEPILYQTLHKGVTEKDISDNLRRTRLWLFYRDILKFYAFHLESAQIIKKFKIIPIDNKKSKILNKAYENLNNLILIMHVENIFKWINKWNIKSSSKTIQKHVIYHDIVADSCQAYKVLKQK